MLFAQHYEWPMDEESMKAEPQPSTSLPAVTMKFGIAVIKGHLVGGIPEVTDSISLYYFMGKDSVIVSKVNKDGEFSFNVPLARTCGVILDSRAFLLLVPGDTTEVWFSQKSPLVKTARKIFVRGPFASLISDLNNARSQRDVISKHLMMDSSDIYEYLAMEKNVTDVLKNIAVAGENLSPLVMDEIIMVCKNPKVVYSRYFPDLITTVRKREIMTTKSFIREAKFASMMDMKEAGQPLDTAVVNSLPESYQMYLESCFCPSR